MLRVFIHSRAHARERKEKKSQKAKQKKEENKEGQGVFATESMLAVLKDSPRSKKADESPVWRIARVHDFSEVHARARAQAAWETEKYKNAPHFNAGR